MANTRARELRANLTDAERHLWYALRQKQLGGHRFRRQVPLGPYIADFVCLAARLIVEVDGGQHSASIEADARRTEWLENRRFRVIRFWNNDVFGNLDGVLQVISMHLARGGDPPP